MYSKYRTTASGKRSGKSPSRRIGLLIWSVTATIAIILQVATWLNAQEMFFLKTIDISGNQCVKKEELLSLFEPDSSKSLFEYDLKQITMKIEEHPFIRQATVSRKFPATLIIQVRELQALAILNGEELLPIDENGEPIANHRLEMLIDYPVISMSGRGAKSAIETRLEMARITAFLRDLRKNLFTLYIEISEITYLESIGICFYLNDNAIPVVFGKGEDPSKGENLLHVLSLLRQKDALASVEYFDARFSNQIIVKEMIKS